MKKDKGFSLVELIIVVAIIAVLTGGVAIGLGVIFDKPADGCAKKMQAVLQNARTTSLGRLDDTIEIGVESGSGKVYVKETVTDKDGTSTVRPIQYIGDSKVSITCKSGTGASMSLPISIKFDRSNGGLIGGKNACSEIKIEAKNRTRYVKLNYITGKITYE